MLRLALLFTMQHSCSVTENISYITLSLALQTFLIGLSIFGSPAVIPIVSLTKPSHFSFPLHYIFLSCPCNSLCNFCLIPHHAPTTPLQPPSPIIPECEALLCPSTCTSCLVHHSFSSGVHERSEKLIDF